MTFQAATELQAPPSRAVNVRLHRFRRRPDDRLVERLRASDPAALEQVVVEYRPLLLAYLSSIIGDRVEAEDVLEQALVEIWRRAPGYDPQRGSLRTWLLMICRARAIDQLRRHAPEPHDPASLSLLGLGDGGEDVEAMLERWRIADMLRRLPLSDAQLLRCRFDEGLSQQQISARLGIPLETVKTSMVRALARLRELIEQDAP